MLGICKRTTSCQYAHSLEDLRSLPLRLTKAGYHFYDGMNLPVKKDMLVILSWAKKFYREEDKSMPKWVNDMVWDLCVPHYMTWLQEKVKSPKEEEEEPKVEEPEVEEPEEDYEEEEEPEVEEPEVEEPEVEEEEAEQLQATPPPPNTPPPPKRRRTSRYETR